MRARVQRAGAGPDEAQAVPAVPAALPRWCIASAPAVNALVNALVHSGSSVRVRECESVRVQAGTLGLPGSRV